MTQEEEVKKKMQEGYNKAKPIVANVTGLIMDVLPYLKKSFVWGYDAFKPTNCLRDLIKAGVLIAAAIDRLQME